MYKDLVNYKTKCFLYRKKSACIVVWTFVLIFLFFMKGCKVYAEEASTEKNTSVSTEASTEEKIEEKTEEKTEVTEPLDVQLSMTVRLYKGDKITLGIKDLRKADRVEVENINSRLAVINDKGELKAKRCGDARCRMVIYSGDTVKTLVLDIKVTKCSYRKRKSLSMYKDEKAKVMASSVTQEATVSLASSNSKSVKLIKNSITAKKKGKSVITASAVKEGRRTELSVTVYVVEKPELKVTNKMADNWFRGSIMAGHSVGVGFEQYCDSQYNGFLGNARHISVGCYGVYNDMAPVSGSSLHPTINGRKARLKDHVYYLGAKKVFINYGLNDIGVYGPDRFVSSYKSLINELIRQNKKTTVYIVSPTPMYKDSGDLCNYNIRKINKQLKKYAKKTSRVEFIDVFTPMLDGSGKLAGAYCSDAYCHITFEGYKVYSDTLKKYAKKKIVEETDARDEAATKKEIKKEQKREKKKAGK